jgi:excisionase family DNA binding protein
VRYGFVIVIASHHLPSLLNSVYSVESSRKQAEKSPKHSGGKMAGSNTARLRSLPEAAERLGLSVKCLRGWVWRRTISYVKVGRAVRISDETIQKIIDRGTMPAIEDRA